MQRADEPMRPMLLSEFRRYGLFQEDVLVSYQRRKGWMCTVFSAARPALPRDLPRLVGL